MRVGKNQLERKKQRKGNEGEGGKKKTRQDEGKDEK